MARRAAQKRQEMWSLADDFKDQSMENIAESLRGQRTVAAEVDEAKFQRLLTRRSVYTDVVQQFSEGDIRQILLHSGNHVPTGMLVMEILTGDEIVAQPPAFFEQGDKKVSPPTIEMSKKR